MLIPKWDAPGKINIGWGLGLLAATGEVNAIA